MDGRQHQRGFTLVELMVTVAVIGVLAKIAYPMFFGESRKAKATSEVSVIMSELAIREEQYKLENGTFMVASACPAVPATAGQSPSACLAANTPWNKMRVRIQQNKLFCSYEIVTGTGTGTNNPAGFTFTSPSTAWFYILATCDMDGKPSLNSTYFMSSEGATIQKKNEGR